MSNLYKIATKIILLIGMAIPCLGQDNQGLGIGDKVPDMVFDNLLDADAKTMNLKDTKGKVVILDFWATWCAPCIASLPKSQEWNRKYSDNLKILPVTYEKREKVRKTIDRVENTKNIEITMPIVVEDTQLASLLPHSSLPHYVWLDGNGTIMAITGIEEVTEENIKKAITGELNIEVKSDKNLPLNLEESIVSGNDHIENKNLLVQSSLIEYVHGWPGSYHPFHAFGDGKIRVLATNYTLKGLYKNAYSYDVFENAIGENRIVLEVSDPEWFNYDGPAGTKFLEWLSAGRGYCYELIIPENRWDERFTIFQDDLNKYFPQYKSALENREKQVLVLRAFDGLDKLTASADAKPFINKSMLNFNMVNGPIQRLPDFLGFYTFQLDKRPLISDLDGDMRVDLDLEGDLTDLDEVNRMLKPYGLEIREETREIPLLIIRDNTTFNPQSKSPTTNPPTP